jgi:hypothetical protein
MARRISDAIENCVNRAVEALEIPQAVKESIEWEIAPALIPTGSLGAREMKLAYMVAISIPVSGSADEDYALQMKPLRDPYAGQAVVTALVTELYGLCQQAADEIRA